MARVVCVLPPLTRRHVVAAVGEVGLVAEMAAICPHFLHGTRAKSQCQKYERVMEEMDPHLARLPAAKINFSPIFIGSNAFSSGSKKECTKVFSIIRLTRILFRQWD